MSFTSRDVASRSWGRAISGADGASRVGTTPERTADHDVLVVGGGFAGCEVAAACAAGGLRTLLVTTSLDTVLKPATDRVALEAPGGTLLADLLADLPRDAEGAVRGWDLHRAAKERLEHTSGLHLLQSDASALRVAGDEGRPTVRGIETWEGVPRFGRRVVLAVGSFLGARLEAGALRERAGRLGEMAYDDLFDDLRRRGVDLGPAEAEGRPGPHAVTYRVRFHRLRDAACGALPGLPRGACAVRAIDGLYAAGLVAGTPLGPANAGYAAATAAGRALGRYVVESAR